jgi:hypothetical protein
MLSYVGVFSLTPLGCYDSILFKDFIYFLKITTLFVLLPMVLNFSIAKLSVLKFLNQC